MEYPIATRISTAALPNKLKLEETVRLTFLSQQLHKTFHVTLCVTFNLKELFFFIKPQFQVLLNRFNVTDFLCVSPVLVTTF
jgi:hypothetical protein